MPRNVRNFWLELEVDGKKTTVATGPVAKDGGFFLRVLQRDKGDIVTAGFMHGSVTPDGGLVLRWEPHEQPAMQIPGDNETKLCVTER